jgi:hypothetical protein
MEGRCRLPCKSFLISLRSTYHFVPDPCINSKVALRVRLLSLISNRSNCEILPGHICRCDGYSVAGLGITNSHRSASVLSDVFTRLLGISKQIFWLFQHLLIHFAVIRFPVAPSNSHSSRILPLGRAVAKSTDGFEKGRGLLYDSDGRHQSGLATRGRSALVSSEYWRPRCGSMSIAADWGRFSEGNHLRTNMEMFPTTELSSWDRSPVIMVIVWLTWLMSWLRRPRAERHRDSVWSLSVTIWNRGCLKAQSTMKLRRVLTDWDEKKPPGWSLPEVTSPPARHGKSLSGIISGHSYGESTFWLPFCSAAFRWFQAWRVGWDFHRMRDRATHYKTKRQCGTGCLRVHWTVSPCRNSSDDG